MSFIQSTILDSDIQWYKRFEFTFDAPLPNGATLFGGTTTERTMSKTCDPPSNPNLLPVCDQTKSGIPARYLFGAFVVRLRRSQGPHMQRAPRVDHLTWLLAGILIGILLGAPTEGSAGQVRLLDLGNRPVDPFQAPPGVKAIVFLFTSTDCPISNRYAPDIRRLYEAFAPKGVLFWLIYPNPADRPEVIREHVKAFAYPAGALRDPQHALVRLAKATVTPEAAVFDARGRLVYRGRIDDRYVDLGLERPAPTRRDLEEALTAMLAGKPVSPAITQAVGCFLADFLR